MLVWPVYSVMWRNAACVTVTLLLELLGLLAHMYKLVVDQPSGWNSLPDPWGWITVALCNWICAIHCTYHQPIKWYLTRYCGGINLTKILIKMLHKKVLTNYSFTSCHLIIHLQYMHSSCLVTSLTQVRLSCTVSLWKTMESWHQWMHHTGQDLCNRCWVTSEQPLFEYGPIHGTVENFLS